MENKKAREIVLLVVKPSIQKVILYLMKSEDFTVNQIELAKEAGVFASTLQKDISKMEDLGIITKSKDGRRNFYKIDKVKIEPIFELLTAIKRIEQDFSDK